MTSTNRIQVGKFCDKIYATQIAALCISLMISIIFCVHVITRSNDKHLTGENAFNVVNEKSIKSASNGFFSEGELNLSTGIYEEG